MKAKSKQRPAATVEEVRQSAREAHQRWAMLNELVRVVDERWGRRSSDDWDYLRSQDDGWEKPIRSVVATVRRELVTAASAARERYRALNRASVIKDDLALPRLPGPSTDVAP